MEGVGLAGDDERDGLDRGSMDLVGPCDFAFADVEGSSGEETHASLGVGGFVFG